MPSLAAQPTRPLLAPRAGAWSPTYEARCPHGHHLPNHAFPLPAGAVRCQHRDVAGGRPCNSLVYVVVCGAAGLTYAVAPVTWDEVRHIQESDLSPLRALEYLGVR